MEFLINTVNRDATRCTMGDSLILFLHRAPGPNDTGVGGLIALSRKGSTPSLRNIIFFTPSVINTTLKGSLDIHHIVAHKLSTC